MAKNEVFKKNTVVVFVVVALGITVMDPFGLSQIRAYCPDFSPVRHDVAPYDQVMKNWNKHVSRRLERGDRVFVDQVFGPESLEFDALGRGPYTGLADGRIVRWMGEDLGWQTFALVTKKWSEKVCANGVNSTTSMQWKVEAHCGRPLGLRFDRKSGDLYIADAYYGLMVVGPEGGLANSLAADVAGKPILFANDLDIHRNGSVFFTDSSQKYNRVKHFFTLLEGEATGRLLRYDPPTRTTHVALNGLSFANGVQLSKDQSFLLYAETTNCRLMKYWLEGPKSGTTELVANLPGFPDNVRLNEKGEFWVTIACCRTKAQEVLSNNPWLKNIYFRLPVPLRYLAALIGTRTSSIIAKFNEKGEMLDVLQDKKGVVMKLASEVREERRKLWIGTVAHNHIATLDLES